MIKERVMEMILPTILGYVLTFIVICGINIVISTIATIGVLVVFVIDVRLALPILFPYKYGYLLNKYKTDKESNRLT